MYILNINWYLFFGCRFPFLELKGPSSFRQYLHFSSLVRLTHWIYIALTSLIFSFNTSAVHICPSRRTGSRRRAIVESTYVVGVVWCRFGQAIDDNVRWRRGKKGEKGREKKEKESWIKALTHIHTPLEICSTKAICQLTNSFPRDIEHIFPYRRGMHSQIMRKGAPISEKATTSHPCLAPLQGLSDKQQPCIPTSSFYEVA